MIEEIIKPLQIGDHVTLAVIERAHCVGVMASVPSLGEAAAILDIDQATLYRKRRGWGMRLKRSVGCPSSSRKEVKRTPVVAMPVPVTAAVEPSKPSKKPPVYTGRMSWHVTPPEGVPLSIYNRDFWTVLRIGLRLLEPQGTMASLWVRHEALEIIDCLPMWQPIPIQRERKRGCHVGWLSVQSTMTLLPHFIGWNVYFDDGMEVPFSMRDNGKNIEGTFE